ncbi:hypothetical protein P7K49_036458 [Saguinus oedipus]|uniref:Cilia- and flagella-associated protein 263 n=1 Tax=Saguinus oedipus TaxID=9490 RepID=A0ABQ9TK65_SAGOE|nr:hypothetical protein P7K49_036458 [Saguinus oedipus]
MPDVSASPAEDKTVRSSPLRHQDLENLGNREKGNLDFLDGPAFLFINQELSPLHASKLHKAVDMCINLDKEILLRKELLEKIEKEMLQVEEDWAKAEAVNKRLRKQLAEFQAPQVMTYVWEKISNEDLEKSIKMWERKVEIAEMSLKGYRKAWNRMKTTNEQLQTDHPDEK